MIRYAYINNLVLDIYKRLPDINFPLNPLEALSLMPNCRYMSYSDFAKISHISVEDVVSLCESRFGCTHYDVAQNRYLILCNQSSDGNNNSGRQRWTLAHELGHIFCRHLEAPAKIKLCHEAFAQPVNIEHEMEADNFARTLLAPMPLIRYLGISSVADVQNTFGLSTEASINTYKKYLNWKSSHYKTAWEVDLVRAYLGEK